MAEPFPNTDPDTLDPNRELPEEASVSEFHYERRVNPRLNDTAAAIGNAVGTAARTVGEMRERFTVIRGNARAETSARVEEFKQSASQNLDEAARRVRAAVEETRERASNKLDEARGRAINALQDLRKKAFSQLNQVRGKANNLREEKPIQMIGAVAASAFLLGVSVRLWRSNRG